MYTQEVDDRRSQEAKDTSGANRYLMDDLASVSSARSIDGRRRDEV